MKLVSIIIPTFGASKSLINTIQSALDQDYENIEIIVVDDNGIGSKNQILTESMLQKLNSDKNIIYIKHKINLGGSAARNSGAKVSKGDYLNFLDDDDLLTKEKIKIQVGQLQNNDFEFAGSYSSRITKKDGKELNRITASKSGYILYEVLMRKVIIGTGSLLMRKDIYEKIGGFDETFKRFQDLEFTIRVCDNYKLVAAPNAFFIRNLLQRNQIKDLNQGMDLTEKYIKIVKLTSTLKEKKVKKVVLSIRVDFFLKALKNNEFKMALNYYYSKKLGIKGVLLSISKIMKYYLITKHNPV